MVACLGIWLSLVGIWVSLVIWVPLFLGLPGVQGPASPVAIWACCPLRHARLVPGHLPTTGIMPLHVRHTNTTTLMGHGLSLLMHRIAQIVDGKLDTPLVFPGMTAVVTEGSRLSCGREVKVADAVFARLKFNFEAKAGMSSPKLLPLKLNSAGKAHSELTD